MGVFEKSGKILAFTEIMPCQTRDIEIEVAFLGEVYGLTFSQES